MPHGDRCDQCVCVPAASAAAVIKLAPSDDWRAVEAAVRKSRPMFRVSGDGFTVTVDEEQKPVEVVVPHHLGLKALPVPAASALPWRA